MGAACGTIICKSKKYQKQGGATIIKRPTEKDFSLDDEEEGTDATTNINAAEMTVVGIGLDGINNVKVMSQELARIGVYFQFDELAVALFRK